MNRIGAGKWLGGRAVASLLALTVVASACNRDEELSGPTIEQRVQAQVETSLEISSATAAVGQRIAVAVVAKTGFTVGGLQGLLYFDPARLAYRGQVVDPSSQSVVVEGKKGLSIVSLNIRSTGLPARSVVLAFEVVGTDYVSGLRYQLSAAGSPDNKYTVEKGRFVGVITAPDLALGSDVRKMSTSDWKQALETAGHGKDKVPFQNPGELRQGLIFGDANFNGIVNVFDVIDVQNVAAASAAPAVQMLNGTDATDRDMVLAANVAPANLPGYGEVGDATPPGVAATGSATNIDSRVVNVFDAIDVSNGAAILCNSADPTFNNFITCHPIPGRDAAAFSTDTVALSCPIIGNRTLKRDTVYVIPVLNGGLNPCFVGGNGDSTVAFQAPATATAVLTIEAGTRIVADSGATLNVGRNGQIFANGTLAQPIVMRCRRATCSAGSWGGLVINGNAQVNNSNGTPSPAITGRQTGGGNQAIAEGNGGNYGGNNNADNSGVLRFVVIEGAGSRFSATNERNGYTMNGVGSGTTVDYLQSVNGLDDGIEFFGGTVNVRHVYIDATQDDGLDWVGGWSGNAQFYIVRGCTAGCDKGVEADNFGIDGAGTDPEAAPRSNPTVANLTLVGSPTPATATVSQAINLRQNTKGTLRNILAFDYKTGLDFDSTGALAGTPPSSPGIIMNLLCQDSLTVRNALLAGSITSQQDAAGATVTSNGDNDGGDPRFADRSPTLPAFGCSSTSGSDYHHSGGGSASFNLELAYLLNPANNIVDDVSRPLGGGGNFYLVAPYATIPDFRPQAARSGDVGLRSGTTGCAMDPTTLGAFFRAAPYCGAVEPVGAVANVPWYAGWTNPR